MHKISLALIALLMLAACGDTLDKSDDDNNPLTAGRRAQATLDVTSATKELKAIAVSSSAAAGVRNKSANAEGKYLLLLTIPSNSATPSVSTSITLSSTAPIKPGDYEVIEGTRDPDHAVVSLNVAQNEPALSGQGLGSSGTITLTALADGRASGVYTVNGRGMWLAGASGAFSFTLTQGSFTDVPIADGQ
jgi:hypothetical protein